MSADWTDEPNEMSLRVGGLAACARRSDSALEFVQNPTLTKLGFGLLPNACSTLSSEYRLRTLSCGTRSSRRRACTELRSVLVAARLTCAARPDAVDGVIVPFFADNESIAQLNLLGPCDPFKSHSTHA